jgi:hypothetical protein
MDFFSCTVQFVLVGGIVVTDSFDNLHESGEVIFNIFLWSH